MEKNISPLIYEFLGGRICRLVDPCVNLWYLLLCCLLPLRIGGSIHRSVVFFTVQIVTVAHPNADP